MMEHEYNAAREYNRIGDSIDTFFDITMTLLVAGMFVGGTYEVLKLNYQVQKATRANESPIVRTLNSE